MIEPSEGKWSRWYSCDDVGRNDEEMSKEVSLKMTLFLIKEVHNVILKKTMHDLNYYINWLQGFTDAKKKDQLNVQAKI